MHVRTHMYDRKHQKWAHSGLISYYVVEQLGGRQGKEGEGFRVYKQCRQLQRSRRYGQHGAWGLNIWADVDVLNQILEAWPDDSDDGYDGEDMLAKIY